MRERAIWVVVKVSYEKSENFRTILRASWREVISNVRKGHIKLGHTVIGVCYI